MLRIVVVDITEILTIESLRNDPDLSCVAVFIISSDANVVLIHVTTT